MKYKKLLLKFLNQGYKPDFFSSSLPKKGAIVLRHDVDFDVDYAYELSKIEDQLEVKSTYFFLIHSKSYNLLENTHIKRIKSIYSNGHHVSIHFDPSIYSDVEEGFKKEKKLFESIFDIEVKCFSIHRPSNFFLNNKKTICGIKHTYQPAFFDDIKYFADSQGKFRYGNPIESKEFKNKDTIQLLLHPIWWVTKSDDPISKLQEFLNFRINKLKKHMASNCTPYRTHLNEE